MRARRGTFVPRPFSVQAFRVWYGVSAVKLTICARLQHPIDAISRVELVSERVFVLTVVDRSAYRARRLSERIKRALVNGSGGSGDGRAEPALHRRRRARNLLHLTRKWRSDESGGAGSVERT